MSKLQDAKVLAEIAKLAIDGWSVLADRSEKRKQEEKERAEKERRIKELEEEVARLKASGGGR